MQDINILGVLNSMVFVYSNIFSNFTLDSLLAQMQLIMLIKTVYIIITSLLPIEGIIQPFFTPFTYLHQMFHAHAAKKLNNKYRGEDGRNSGLVRISTNLGYSTWNKSEYSGMSFFFSNSSVLTTRDISYFANSSMAPSLIALVVIVSVGPLMQQFFFAIIHFYILCGITLFLMPSKADSKLIMNYIIVRTEISSWYIINIVFVFLITSSTYALKYQFLGYYPNYWYIEPILMGIWSSICYIVLLMFILMMTEEKSVFKNRQYQYHFSNERVRINEEEIIDDMEIR